MNIFMCYDSTSIVILINLLLKLVAAHCLVIFTPNSLQVVFVRLWTNLIVVVLLAVNYFMLYSLL